jgi:Ca2+-binding EF-hand superfamily protein
LRTVESDYKEIESILKRHGINPTEFLVDDLVEVVSKAYLEAKREERGSLE